MKADDKKVVLACVDGSKFSEAVCDYGAMIAKRLDIPLKLLNTVEHPHLPPKTDLSGNIGLGSSDELLEELASDEHDKSKERIKNGKDVLDRLKIRALEAGVKEVITSQRHGELYENLIELQSIIRVLIIGLSGKDSQKGVGAQVEEILRSLRVPTFLINQEFKTPKKIAIAYDGKEGAEKALEMIAKSPLFSDVERDIVSVAKDRKKAEELLEKAILLLRANGIEAKPVILEGEPASEIIAYQENEDVDITAMGAFSHARLKSAIFGSTTSKILKSTKKPLLILR